MSPPVFIAFHELIRYIGKAKLVSSFFVEMEEGDAVKQLLGHS